SRPRPWQGRALPTELFPQNTLFLLCRTNENLHRYGERIIRKIARQASPLTQNFYFFVRLLINSTL
ncbi:hypothetical protein ACOT1K_14995, partial [Providencia manganoxydans]|uniref:hypothetical protein n=1 Tax=Providencia TaxID=586 RepID=UPI001C58BA95